MSLIDLCLSNNQNLDQDCLGKINNSFNLLLGTFGLIGMQSKDEREIINNSFNLPPPIIIMDR